MSKTIILLIISICAFSNSYAFFLEGVSVGLTNLEVSHEVSNKYNNDAVIRFTPNGPEASMLLDLKTVFGTIGLFRMSQYDRDSIYPATKLESYYYKKNMGALEFILSYFRFSGAILSMNESESYTGNYSQEEYLFQTSYYWDKKYLDLIQFDPTEDYNYLNNKKDFNYSVLFTGYYNKSRINYPVDYSAENTTYINENEIYPPRSIRSSSFGLLAGADAYYRFYQWYFIRLKGALGAGYRYDNRSNFNQNPDDYKKIELLMNFNFSTGFVFKDHHKLALSADNYTRQVTNSHNSVYDTMAKIYFLYTYYF